MSNDLPQSERDSNTDRRHMAAIAHVREKESCHFCSGFIDWDGLYVPGCATPLCWWLCSTLTMQRSRFPPATTDVCCEYINRCGHLSPTKHLLEVKHCHFSLSDGKKKKNLRVALANCINSYGVGQRKMETGGHFYKLLQSRSYDL